MAATQRFEVRHDDAVLVGDRTPARGEGPAVVFLHAGVADRRSWTAVVDDLAAGGHPGALVSYDRRGYGDSPPSPPGYTHLADLLAVLDEVSPDGPAWLVGSSMGGPLALEAAVTAPDRIAGLVLIAPGVAGMPGYAEDPPETEALAERHRLAYEHRDVEEINRVEAHLWLDGPTAPEGRVGGPARELFLAMNAVALANEGDEATGDSDVEVWSRLPDLALPVTLVYGELDAEVPREDPPLFVQHRPATRWEVWPGRSHLPYLEDPAQTADLVRRALSAGQ